MPLSLTKVVEKQRPYLHLKCIHAARCTRKASKRAHVEDQPELHRFYLKKKKKQL